MKYEDEKTYELISLGTGQVEELKNLSQEVLLTIIGVRILQDRFASDKLKWKLVVSKSKKYIRQQLGLQNNTEVDALIAKFKFK